MARNAQSTRVCVWDSVGGTGILPPTHITEASDQQLCLSTYILFLIIELNTSYTKLKQFRIVHFGIPQKITSQDGLLAARVTVHALGRGVVLAQGDRCQAACWLQSPCTCAGISGEVTRNGVPILRWLHVTPLPSGIAVPLTPPPLCQGVFSPGPQQAWEVL